MMHTSLHRAKAAVLIRLIAQTVVSPKKSLTLSIKLVHTVEIFEFRVVNKLFGDGKNYLFPLVVFSCSHFIQTAIPVNKLCISIHCRKWVFRYYVHSSLKE